MSSETKPSASALSTAEPTAPAKTEAVAAGPKPARNARTGKRARRRQSSSQARPRGEKLVCRCGSDDLAPSFKQRRDARCRACFKQRYGLAARNKKVVRKRKAK